MKGCDSYSSGCTLPDIPTETLVINMPKQFLDENPTYVTSAFSSDSDKALENHQAMMARFDETHGKIMLALQSGCTSSDEVNRLIATSNELTVQSCTFLRNEYSTAKIHQPVGAIGDCNRLAIFIGIFRVLMRKHMCSTTQRRRRQR